ncbi:unnamed protein product [Orchesella dallaii]|uniref:Uncharacterized protein n=1 Tax=Orchesella dallaii TaxID=48710 RepID=A0ABP1RD66_9HEXA
MTSTVQELSVVCKWYEELIGLCEAQIATIRNCENTRSPFLKPGENRDELEEDSTINIDSSSLNKIRFQELSNVILRCSDADFLDVLRSELERQRDFHRKRIQLLQTSKVQFKVNITTAPLQSFFKNSVYNADGDVITKYYHFEGENIAREIHVNNNQSPSLLITGYCIIFHTKQTKKELYQ